MKGPENSPTHWVDYYASIELAVSDDENFGKLSTIVIDAIPKSAAKALKSLKFDGPTEDLDNVLPIFMLTANLNPQQAKKLADDSSWIELSIGTENVGGDDVFEATSISLGGDEEGGRRTFWVKVKSTSVAKRTLCGLATLAEFASIADAGDADLQLFDAAQDLRGVAIYDVGQANLTALVDSYEHPVVFFDLGWPLSFNKKSYRLPGPFDPLTPALRPGDPQPVILSHLDWDHWGYAYLSGQARYDSQRGYWRSVVTYKDDVLRRPWLMRRPRFHRHKLGPSHIHFVMTLANTTLSDGNCALKFWPARSGRKDFTHYSIVRCSSTLGSVSSPAYLRNNESLVLLAKREDRPEKVLLTGDADYPSIHVSHRRKLTGIVAPHHGGNITEFSTPQALFGGRMVRSTFPECYNNVPSDDAEMEALLSGWQIHSTNDRFSCHAGCSAHGNKLIALDVPTPYCSCGGVPEAGLCLR